MSKAKSKTRRIIASVRAPQGSLAHTAQLIKASEDLQRTASSKSKSKREAEQASAKALLPENRPSGLRDRLKEIAIKKREHYPSDTIKTISGAAGAALKCGCKVSDFRTFARADLIEIASEHSLSIAELERQLGYTGGMIFMIIRGERFISYELVGRLLARFGIEDAQRVSDWLLLSGEVKL